ncbi:MAG: AAA family ATPase [Muribaculaceae bacterium]|nr:AAA family ATPase [Muribaculaceae bacterium]
MPTSPIFLIGFMGAGKTTLGRALEARLPGWRYVDLDEEVERHAGMSVAKIFSVHGEGAFRKMERQALADAVNSTERLIVGCGGGTPCFFDNMELMNSSGVTILLQARNSTLLRRLVEAQAQRPKLNGFTPGEIERFITESLAQREPWYSLARHRFPSDRLETPAEIEASCRLFIRKFINGE